MWATQTERGQVLERIDATIDAIESAVAKGRDLKSRDATTARARREQIDVLIDQIDELASH